MLRAIKLPIYNLNLNINLYQNTEYMNNLIDDNHSIFPDPYEEEYQYFRSIRLLNEVDPILSKN